MAGSAAAPPTTNMSATIHRVHRAARCRRDQRLRRHRRRRLRQRARRVVIGLSTELIKHRGPWRTAGQVEIAALDYIDWFNHRRLYEACGDIRQPNSRPPTTVTPPASPRPGDSTRRVSGHAGSIQRRSALRVSASAGGSLLGYATGSSIRARSAGVAREASSSSLARAGNSAVMNRRCRSATAVLSGC
jgi:hypothetical protein